MYTRPGSRRLPRLGRHPSSAPRHHPRLPSSQPLPRKVQDAFIIPYAEIPHFPHPTVEGPSVSSSSALSASRRRRDVRPVCIPTRVPYVDQVTFPRSSSSSFVSIALSVTNAAGASTPPMARPIVGKSLPLNSQSTNAFLGSNDVRFVGRTLPRYDQRRLRRASPRWLRQRRNEQGGQPQHGCLRCCSCAPAMRHRRRSVPSHSPVQTSSHVYRS